MGKSGVELYGDFAMMVDAQIGRVLAALDEAGMTDDTLVIFTSDNGPDWYPVDVQRFGHDSARCLRGMKSDTWEAGHRMPFIVRWPGRVKAGSQSKQTICFTDLLATFADICGTKLPEDAGPDSTSFLPVLLGKQPINPSTRRFRRRMPTLRTWTRRSRTKRSAPMPRWSKHWIATLPPFSMNSTNSACVRTPSWFYQRKRRDDKRKQPAIQCGQTHRL